MTTGVENTIIGGLAGDALTTGSYNVAIGHLALSSEDEHDHNVAIGRNALQQQMRVHMLITPLLVMLLVVMFQQVSKTFL